MSSRGGEKTFFALPSIPETPLCCQVSDASASDSATATPDASTGLIWSEDSGQLGSEELRIVYKQLFKRLILQQRQRIPRDRKMMDFNGAVGRQLIKVHQVKWPSEGI
jgi:hypothetical protein